MCLFIFTICNKFKTQKEMRRKLYSSRSVTVEGLVYDNVITEIQIQAAKIEIRRKPAKIVKLYELINHYRQEENLATCN